MKSTLFHPQGRKRNKKHGFLRRSERQAGRRVLQRRRRKGRQRLTV